MAEYVIYPLMVSRCISGVTNELGQSAAHGCGCNHGTHNVYYAFCTHTCSREFRSPQFHLSSFCAHIAFLSSISGLFLQSTLFHGRRTIVAMKSSKTVRQVQQEKYSISSLSSWRFCQRPHTYAIRSDDFTHSSALAPTTTALLSELPVR
jgi:hypothetical protein